MQLTPACLSILRQLEDVVENLSDEDFVKPCPSLSGVTIGQHLRHTLEFFLCLERGFGDRVINYDKRKHDSVIETNRKAALAALGRIRSFVCTARNIPLRLEVGYDRHSDDSVSVESNYYRELIYNIEHAVHHMAIMKIGIRDIAAYIQLPQDFGIAVSTLRFADSAASISS